MARRTQSRIQFDAIAIEGGLLAPDMLAAIAAPASEKDAALAYGIPKGLQLRDEIGRFWRIAQALWSEFATARANPKHDGATVARTFTDQLLRQVLGFGDLTTAGRRTVGERVFPVAFEAAGGRVPVVVGAPLERLDDSVERHGDPERGVRKRSAWGVLQEYLNAADTALWGIVTNGLTLRIGRDNASLTRPAWIEVDLERVFTEERFSDFSMLWLLAHASRFGRDGQPVTDCALEQWRTEGREQGSRAREQLRGGVEAALKALGQGFLEHRTNTTLRAALADGSLTPPAYFNELLRLVYRVIFLLTVEERGILHPEPPENEEERRRYDEAVRLYADGYGLRRLRERAVRHSAHDRHDDLWRSLKPVFGALGRDGGEPSLALPGLGGLFGTDQCPHLDGGALENRRLLTAVFHLAWLREGDALARVNWKDMGVEEFGSVYESLLELVPVIGADLRTFSFAGEDESAGNARKTSGSYYTPDSLVQQLLDTTLEPVVADRLAAQPEQKAQAILDITVVDPACGSGHFLLGAARRLAGHLARVRAGGTPGAAEYRHALRDVVTHCIHGVDRNPMAIELARMALWLEAYTPDRALGFLDHHLVCGDALLGLIDLKAVGAGIPDEAFKALTGDDKDVAKVVTKLNREARRSLEAEAKRGQLSLALGTETLAQKFAALDALADDGLDSVATKRAQYAALRAEAEQDRLALAADLFVGAFLVPKQLAPGEKALTEQQAAQRFPTTASVRMALEGTLGATHPVATATRQVCAEARVFHWPLAFPQVFAKGGFDVVLGNPPWEVSQLSEEEFFAQRAPQVAQAKNKTARSREIAKLADAPADSAERRLFEEFQRAQHRSEAVNVAYRGNPRFALTAVGKLNTYPLFAESMYRMRSPAGRAGLIVPTGIATDDSTKAFFSELADNGRLVSLYDFENRLPLFPAVDSRMKFAALTIGSAQEADFAFFATQVHELIDPRRRFQLAPADFKLINPNTRTCPTFRSAYDAELTKKIYRHVPVLIDESREGADGNPWGVSFSQGLFNMATDSDLFEDAPGEGLLPLYEAKYIGQYDHRRGTYDARLAGDRGFRVLPEPTLEQRQTPNYSIKPFYWVSESETRAQVPTGYNYEWFLGFKDVTAATNERTVLASIIPFSGVGHTLPLVFSTSGPFGYPLLLANLNSLVLDYCARQKVNGLHLTYGYVKQFPILPPSRIDRAGRDFIVARVVELTFVSEDVEAFARDLEYAGKPYRWDPERRAILRAELDAWYAKAYGLTRDELRYILDPADVMGPDWPSETFRVLKNNEEREFGEYRTRRLVLEAWDRLFG